VDNPFVKQQTVQTAPVSLTPVAQGSTAGPAKAQPVAVPPKPEVRTPIPVVGAMVDTDAPVAYRLPSVSSFAPTPVDASAGPSPPVVLPPQPPSAESLVQAPTTTADEKHGPDVALSESILQKQPQRDAFETGQRRLERSLLHDNLSVTDLPLPPSVEAAAPSVPSHASESTNNAPVEAVSPVVPTYVPTATELTTQLLPAVQRGYDLAQRGALFAAQTEFVQVLRRVAQAKDATARSDEHSQALAAGLRALDEAEDFVPKGIQLEADLNLRIVASSHRTPVLRDYPEELLAHQAVALYLSFAEAQLAQAATSEQAGSMALHGLGKIYARLAERNDDDVQFTQRATAMYSAALAARPDNHLAANELGVLLCRGGRAAEAAPLFERAIDAAPSALAYHNLAVAQQKLGMLGQAAANERESQRLAAWERTTGAVSQQAGIQWVTPAEISRVAQTAPLTTASYNVSAATPNSVAPHPYTASAAIGEKSTWQKVADFGRSLPLPSLDSTKNILNVHPETRIARPFPAQSSQGVTGPGTYR
jgi:tetratricopeptide (TPR) repeat protein